MAEDEGSCAMLWDAGVPCWVDKYCPRGEALPEGDGLALDQLSTCSYRWLSGTAAGQYREARNHWCMLWPRLLLPPLLS